MKTSLALLLLALAGVAAAFCCAVDARRTAKAAVDQARQQASSMPWQASLSCQALPDGRLASLCVESASGNSFLLSAASERRPILVDRGDGEETAWLFVVIADDEPQVNIADP